MALQQIDATDGPIAGAHSFYRGTSPKYYDNETQECLQALCGRIDTDAAATVWDAALATTWGRAPVWFHGDVASGNLLVRDGRLSAVIDFGTRRRRPRLRPRHRVDLIPWAKPRGLPRPRAAKRRYLGAGPWLGALEGADQPRRTMPTTQPGNNAPIIEEVIADHERYG